MIKRSLKLRIKSVKKYHVIAILVFSGNEHPVILLSVIRFVNREDPADISHRSFIFPNASDILEVR